MELTPGEPAAWTEEAAPVRDIEDLMREELELTPLEAIEKEEQRAEPEEQPLKVFQE
jgi:hypothetical protein